MPSLRRLRPLRLSNSALALVSINALFLTFLTLFVTQRECHSFKFWFDVQQQSPGLDPVADVQREVVPQQTLAPALTTKPVRVIPDYCDCGPADTFCAQYGEARLSRSRAFEGANARFRRVLRDAQAGRPVKIAVIGGSVTRGQGIHTNENWVYLFNQWWNSTFPDAQTTIHNGAVPATGTDYMRVCFAEHMDEDVDIVFTEFAINDQRKESNTDSFESLTRNLLGLPKSPAVVHLQTFGLGYALLTTGGDLHTAVANYYDTPVVSLRNVLLPEILDDPANDAHYFAKLNPTTPDYKHINLHGHRVLADLLAAYTQRQLCALASNPSPPSQQQLEEIPRLRLMQKYDRTSVVPKMQPFCSSTRTTKHPLVPLSSDGWDLWAHEKFKHKPYVRATRPGAKVSFAVPVREGALGRVRVTFLRSKTFGLGSVRCWLDEDTARGVRVDGYWDVDVLNLAGTAVITQKAQPGEHVLWCELLKDTKDPSGGTDFRIVAVDAT